MNFALYHPESGYYRQAADAVLGGQGDFFTASQLQPIFGRLISELLPHEPVLELGPGRGEMRRALAPRSYRSVDLGDALPQRWTGTIFANEFFDALPVTAGVLQGGRLRQLFVERRGVAYRWVVGPELCPAREHYVRTYYPDLKDGARFEIAERSIDAIRRISECLTSGTVMIIDYGWSANEYLRFPEGTLIGYRRHTAVADVLSAPGQQDITAHVCFSALMDAAQTFGLAVERFETLTQTLLRALQGAPHLLNDPSNALQLKTLLFGMGQSFRTLLLKKVTAK